MKIFKLSKGQTSIANPRLSSCNIWLNLAWWFLRSDVVHTDMYEKNVYFQTQKLLKLDQINMFENFEKTDIIPESLAMCMSDMNEFYWIVSEIWRGMDGETDIRTNRWTGPISTSPSGDQGQVGLNNLLFSYNNGKGFMGEIL